MDGLYDNLLEYYDELFPVDSERIAFVEKLAAEYASGKKTEPYKAKLIDVGSATGTFAIALMRRGFDVTGVDNNPTMIQSACRRNPEPRTNCRFFRMDMLEIGSAFAHGTYDMVLCLGNTLVHMDNLADIKRFMEQAYALLSKGGHFVFQVVNYERVMAERMTRLPTIETMRARFEREYRPRDDGRLSFEATLYASSGQAVFKDRVILYPAGADELTKLAKTVGFKDIKLYDDFSGGDFTGTDLGIVCTARR